MRLDHFGMYPERAFNKVAGRMTLEGGGKGSMPPAPDYAAAAQQTAAGNLATARIGQYGNMVNQYTPQGSVTYTPKTVGYIGTSGNQISPEEYWSWGADARQGYSPLEQWTQTVTMSPEQQAAYKEDAAMNSRLRGVANQGIDYVQSALNKPLAAPDNAMRSVEMSNFRKDIANRELQNKIADAGQLQRSVDDPELVQQQVTDALYKNQTQYLDPQFNQTQSKLENQLANQGITRGSEAWNNAMDNFGRQKQQAYESARQSSIGQGVNAGNTMFQNKLAGGQFVNQAQGQQFGQNQAQLQAYNDAQQGMFGQDLSRANLWNSAESQLFDQRLANAQLNNAAIQQDFANQQTLRQEPINILNAVRTGSQLQSAQQPQVGVSQPGQLATVSGPDYLSAATAQGQYNQGLYNANQAANGNMMSGLFGLGSAGIGAYGLMNAAPLAASDRRVKENIIKIGALDNGLNLYKFDYKPEWKDEFGHGSFVGVMAQEAEGVMPNAVITRPDGYKMVDYGVIYG